MQLTNESTQGLAVDTARKRFGVDLVAQLLACLATMPEMAVGEFTGTGTTAAILATLPFDAAIVFILDATAPIINVVVKTAGATNHYSIAAAGGISVVGANGVSFGAAGTHTFGVGTDTKANVNARVYQYVAFAF